MVPRLAEELLNLHRGQGMDLFWRDSLTCPTEEEYIEMVNNSMWSLNPGLRSDLTLLVHFHRDRRPLPASCQTDDGQ